MDVLEASAAPSPPLTRDQKDVAIIRNLYFAGCALLPWLWIMCLLHYRKRLWDKDAPTDMRWCEFGFDTWRRQLRVAPVLARGEYYNTMYTE